MTTERPHILWICTDQQRFDTIGALGNFDASIVIHDPGSTRMGRF